MKETNNFSLECRPPMLKDFLVMDDSISCSSSGFNSFPRQQCDDLCIRNLIEIDFNARNIPKSNNAQRLLLLLLRSRSKSASTTISAFQAMINAVKSPSILPRSLWRRLSKRNSLEKKNEKKECEPKITVRVKDIIRWRSSRDLIEEKSTPLDFASSPHHCTTTTTTTTTGCTGSPRSSNDGSSWCDSDFTSEDLPSWSGNSEEYGENYVEVRKKYLSCVGRDSMEATTENATYTAVGPKGVLPREEKEQHSPVSVFDFQCEKDEESLSSFNQSLTNMEITKQKFTQKVGRFESIAANLDPVNLEKWISLEETTGYEEEEEEGRAMQLLNHVKATNSEGGCKENVEQLLFDFFREELTTRRYQSRINDDEFDDSEMVRLAKEWMSGKNSATIEWGVYHKKEAYVREMNRGGRWSKFEEEQEELVLDIESRVLGLLVDELLVDLLSC